ncbi:MAG: PIG-L family deacetylase [Acidimicrobiales bacterium]
MPTAAFVHPHPDDEAIFTGGAMRRAADTGWHVVLVMATSGEEGELPDWVQLDAADHRRMETAAAAAELGVHELHYLGYRDSGMAGTAANLAAGALATSIAAATADLAALLGRVGADAVVGQDPNGIYGHPDHLAVHRIVTDAAAEAGVPEHLEATLDRDWLVALRAERIATGRLAPEAWCGAELARLGVARTSGGWATGAGDPPAALVHLDVAAELGAKQAAMAAHASQVPDAIDFMGIPPGTFHQVVAHEWYLRRAASPGPLERALTTS